jgi:quercetin dioxygenase-like cupin family protein
LGYVLKGKLTYTTADGEETFEAGDAYYVAPGHTPKLYAGTEIVEFSPTKELQETLAVVTRNMESAG